MLIEIYSDPVIGIPNDTTICRGDSINLFATDIETVVWSPNYAIDDTLSLTPVVYQIPQRPMWSSVLIVMVALVN